MSFSESLKIFQVFHIRALFLRPFNKTSRIDALREGSDSERRKEDVEDTSKARKRRKRRYCEEPRIPFGSLN